MSRRGSAFINNGISHVLSKELVEYLLGSQYREVLVAEWKRIQHSLDCPSLDIANLHDGYRNGTFCGTEIFSGLLKDWIVRNGDSATIGKLGECLKTANLDACGDQLMQDYDPSLTVVERPRYNGVDLLTPPLIPVAQSTELVQMSHETWFDTLKFVGLLGNGSFGFVFKARDKITKEYSAVKIIFPEYPDPTNKEQQKQTLTREFRELNGKYHNNVVQCLEFLPEKYFSENDINSHFLQNSLIILDKTSRSKILVQSMEAKEEGSVEAMCIKMELCGPTLRTWLTAIERREIIPRNKLRVEIGQGIISGIKFLHQVGILHRDLKPENIYFKATGYLLPVKIGDFGVCREIEGNHSCTLTIDRGTYLYRAPEAMQRERYGKQADLYSLGLVLWEVFEIVPFDSLQYYFDRLVKFKDIGLVHHNDFVPKLREVIISLTKFEKKERASPDDDIDLLH